MVKYVGYSGGSEAKVTQHQRKEHVKQMSEEELIYLRNYVRAIPRIRYRTNHLSMRIAQGKITLEMRDVLLTMHDPTFIQNVIEYNEVKNYKVHKIMQRVLFRLKEPKLMIFNGKKQMVNIYVVLELSTNTIVTAYANATMDGHKTLDKGRYGTNLHVKKVVKGGIPFGKKAKNKVNHESKKKFINTSNIKFKPERKRKAG